MGSHPQVLFGRKVRAIRDALNVSREIIAEKSGITSNYLGEVERGEKWPSIEIIGAIAAALNVPLADFFAFEAEEVDSHVLNHKLHAILENTSVEQKQIALRILKSLLER
jgi:XRE family transcriptional regulator, regulator of sulfur utilization